MRILQINNYHYLKGGSERVYFETSSLLQEQGHEVIHFSVADKEAFDSETKKYFIAPVDYLGGGLANKLSSTVSFLYSLEARKKLQRLLSDYRPDIAHLHIFYGRLTSSILPVLKKNRIPTVMTVHEYKLICPMYTMLDKYGEICNKCATQNYMHCILKRCNRDKYAYSFLSAIESAVRDLFFSYEKYIDKFVMVSDFTQKEHLHNRESLRDKTVRIYNFIGEDPHIPQQNKEYYLYVGRLSREKGLLTLLEAWKKFPHRKLMIAGDGVLADELKKFIAENNMNNVEMLGFLSGQQLKNVISGAKFSIVPSEWYETFGLSVLESFSVGVPVIASSIGAIPELISDGFNGFLFKCADVMSLIDAVNNAESLSSDVYSAMSENAHSTARQRFSREKYYESLIKLYASLVQGK